MTYIDHECAHSIRISARTTPIIMMSVMTTLAISLSPQPLNMKIRPPSLEGSRSVLDTANDIIPIDESNLRVAHFRLN